MQVLHATLMASHKRFTASDEHRMITLTMPSAHLRLCTKPEKIYHAQFFFSIKPNPKNGTGFRIRYSEMDISGIGVGQKTY